VGHEAYTVWGGGLYLRKRYKNHEYKVRYESEYLFRTHPRALEGARANEWPSS
jgi:hypothetical protein